MSHRCGSVALVGRPNTGKSSLLNRLIGEKLSIVSRRPQTTRHLVTGVLTRPECQYIFIDSPGNPPRLTSVLHKALNRRVAEAAGEADVVLFVVEALRFGAEDRAALERIPAGQKVLAVVNKADTPGADRSVSALRESAEFRAHAAGPDAWVPPVLKSQATDGTGVDDIRQVRLGVVSAVGTAVPEPATWAMMLGGFAVLGTALRRRKTPARMTA